MKCHAIIWPTRVNANMALFSQRFSRPRAEEVFFGTRQKKKLGTTSGGFEFKRLRVAVWHICTMAIIPVACLFCVQCRWMLHILHHIYESGRCSRVGMDQDDSIAVQAHFRICIMRELSEFICSLCQQRYCGRRGLCVWVDVGEVK